jgi:hypothetical protein
VTQLHVRAWSLARPCALIGVMADAALAEENARLRPKLAETEAAQQRRFNAVSSLQLVAAWRHLIKHESESYSCRDPSGKDLNWHLLALVLMLP